MAALITSTAGHGDRKSFPASVNGREQTAAKAMIDWVIRRQFAGNTEFEHTTHAITVGALAPIKHSEMVDLLFLVADETHNPEDVFERVRWGGQVVFISRDKAAVEAAVKRLAGWRVETGQRGAWAIDHPLTTVRKSLFNLRVLGWRAGVYYIVVRKAMLVAPGKSTDRFTYNVYLEKNRQTGHYEVVKEVPTAERVLARLREKFPDADEELLQRRAKKFSDRVFPIFLTRETAMLKLLERDLPSPFRHKVPRLLSAETDSQGLTRTLRMNWLRNARVPVNGRRGDHGRALTQLEFARQAAELLAALHDAAGIMHLDLRLDNFVITHHGVGFVDFGSAVRVGEQIADSPMLSGLFDEMMRTSQIQRMLGKMTQSGQVTSGEICGSFGRIDKAVDFFYLALQINAPHSNPEFEGLIEFDPKSEEAKALAGLTEEILRPAEGQKAKFTSASDILGGIKEIEQRIGVH